MRLMGRLPLACALGLMGSRPLVAAFDSPAQDILATGKALYSHAKEELIIRDFFHDRRGGFFLDVGCGHPIQDSNTYYLEKHLGWSGIAVDALPEFARKWRRNRPASKFFNLLVTDHADTLDPFYRAELRVRDISSGEKPVRGPGGGAVVSEEDRVVSPPNSKDRWLSASWK